MQKHHRVRVRNDIFSGKPIEIKALRKALGWCQRDLALYLGLYTMVHRRDTITMLRWETGKTKPSRPYMEKMVRLVEKFRPEYLQALKELRAFEREHGRLPRQILKKKRHKVTC